MYHAAGPIHGEFQDALRCNWQDEYFGTVPLGHMKSATKQGNQPLLHPLRIERTQR